MIGSFFIFISFLVDALEFLKGLMVNLRCVKYEKILSTDKNNKMPIREVI